MKKFVYFLIVFLFSAYSTVGAESGDSFNVNSAREYVLKGQINSTDIAGPMKLKAGNVERTVRSYNPAGDLIGITVLYKGESDKTYIYNAQNKLIYVEKYDKPVNVYPHRGYRYNTDGELILTSLTVSKNEMYRFDPEGNLIAHSINGIIYDENGNIIGRGK